MVHREKTVTAKRLNSRINLPDLGQQSVREWDMGCIIGLPLLMWSGHISFCHRAHTGSEIDPPYIQLELVRNLVAHGDAREGKWRGNWRMEWVASTLAPPLNVVYPALLKLICTPRLPAVDWTDAPTDLNGLVRFGERRNLVSARVPSRSARAILTFT